MAVRDWEYYNPKTGEGSSGAEVYDDPRDPKGGCLLSLPVGAIVVSLIALLRRTR